MHRSSAQLRAEATRAATRADLLDLFAVRGPLRLMVDLCTGGRQLVRGSSSSLASEVRWIPQARPRSGGRESSHRGSKSSRARPDVHSDTGFEFARCDLALRPEIWPAVPHLQRITRSPRSRPSLHGSASKHVQTHRSCTRMHDRTRRRGGGTWRGDLGDSRQAAARQPHSRRTSPSTTKSAASRRWQGRLEPTGRPRRVRCAAGVMRAQHLLWCAHRERSSNCRLKSSETRQPHGVDQNERIFGCSGYEQQRW